MRTRPPFSARTQRYLQARSEANFLVDIRILRVGLGILDPLTGLVGAGSAATIYDGKAHVHTVSGGGVVMAGEDSIDTRTTAISVPFDIDPPVHDDDVVMVDSYPSDSNLESKAFRVVAIDGGGLMRAYCTLTCVGYEENRWWES